MDGILPAVELLERAVGYTRGTLAHVTDARLDAPTPCTAWRLRDLLDHMADSLDAFTEASSGLLPVTPVPARGTRVDVLRTKACTLLGAWSSPAAATIRLDDRLLDATVLLQAGALEIAVHGWDVGQATGVGVPLPEGLARDLAPVAHALVDERDRGHRFAPANVWTGPRTASASILGFCGRQPLQHHQSQQELG